MITIKNMKMPRCCYICPMCTYDDITIDYFCKLIWYMTLDEKSSILNSKEIKEKRYCDCPLEEVNE